MMTDFCSSRTSDLAEFIRLLRMEPRWKRGILRSGSPRLREEPGGFLVRIEAGDRQAAACLLSPRQAVLGCADVGLRAGESHDQLARRLAAQFHQRMFAPRVDLTQGDLRSLDGSTLAGGGRSAERLRVIVEGLSD